MTDSRKGAWIPGTHKEPAQNPGSWFEELRWDPRELEDPLLEHVIQEWVNLPEDFE